MVVGMFLSFLVEASEDDGLTDFMHLPFNNFFGFKNVAKFIPFPIFKPNFDMFQYFMQENHFCALNFHILFPPFFNIANKVSMVQPYTFKPERSVPWSSYTRCLKLNQPMV